MQSEFRLNLVMAQGGHGEGLLGPRKLNESSALIELTLTGKTHIQTHIRIPMLVISHKSPHDMSKTNPLTHPFNRWRRW